MSLREAERRQRAPAFDDHEVLTIKEWRALNKISARTAGRILASGDGPVVTRMSPRRIGITRGNNAAWQKARSA